MPDAARADVYVRCPDGHVLAERVGDVYIQRHRGRTTVSRELLSVRCEQCGKEWTLQSRPA